MMFPLYVGGELEQAMPATRVLALERADRLVRQKRYHVHVCHSGQRQRPGKLVDVELEVAAQLQATCQCEQIGESRVAMPAPLEVPGLGPGVGIEQIVIRKLPAGLNGQAPEIGEFGANQTGIGWQLNRPGQASGALVDTDDQT